MKKFLLAVSVMFWGICRFLHRIASQMPIRNFALTIIRLLRDGIESA